MNTLRIPFLAIIVVGLVLGLMSILLAPEVEKQKGEEETPEASIYQFQKISFDEFLADKS